jgi:hypothetical protein
MKRKLVVLAAGIAALTAVTATALAVTPGETPFPSPTIKDLMVTANTSNGSAPDAILTSRFQHNATVVFRVFAANVKTKQVLTAQDVRYAFIKIPNQPNVRLTYQAPTTRNGANFVGTWQVPTLYPLGLVDFTVRFQTQNRLFGNFVQIPVTSAQLTIVQ